MGNKGGLQIRMLGGLSLTLNGREINDGDNRSKKVWLLLAYMIYCRNRTISQEELVDLLWSAEEGSSNPANALKTMFHRVRSTLDQLDATAGHTLIIRKEGTYAWNTDVPFSLDVDTFESLCRAAAAVGDDDARLQLYQQALELYRGDFLPKLGSETWVVPVSAYFHNLYLQTVGETLTLLENRRQPAEAAEVCRRATAVEPYDEELYRHLMRALLELGDQKGVVSVYESMSQLLFDNFGVMPEAETRELYRNAVRSVNDQEVSLDFVQEQLQEPASAEGALFCEYDFFKVLYHAEARGLARSGNAIHVGLLSVSGENGEPLPRRSLDICMENLQSIVCSNLRKGDAASRCSVSQYILLLPQANYENACMVMTRIIRAFFRQYPHSPAQLRATVQPLEPNA